MSMDIRVSKQELKMKDILRELLPDEPYIDNYRPDWLKNPLTGYNLEIDRFYPNLKLAIEFNGYMHQKKISEAQWSRDKIKKKLCAKNKISLVIVKPKELTKKIITQKLKDLEDMKECWKNGKAWSRK